MTNQTKLFYEFGPFRLDTAERLLLREGRPVPLTPKAYEMLLALVERSGHIVNKDELLKGVWPDQFVEEGNLTQHVFALRKALGESSGGARYIETVPRRGYRFAAGVRERRDERIQTTETHIHGRAVTEKSVRRREIDSLVVLPLVNAWADPSGEYLSDGITESLINIISQVPELRVVPRSTAFRYKGRAVDPQEAGRELGVRAALAGRVCQIGHMLMVQVDLIDVANQAQIWGAQYRREMADIFDVQEAIAREIFDKLRVRLTGEQQRRVGKRHTENADAYRAYLKGRYHWNKRTEAGLKKSRHYFQEAVDTDPAYAPAYAGLADSYALPGIAEYGLLPPREAMPRAKAAALRALEIDETLAEAQTTLAHVQAFYEWDWTGAEREFRRAIELNPDYAFSHHWYALYLAAMGRHAEAIAEEGRALEIDPLSLIINKNVGTILYYAGELDRSIEQYRKTLELEPDFARTHIYLGLAYARKGLYEAALAEYQEAMTISGGGTVLAALLGHAYALSGNREEAMKIIGDLREQAKRHYVPAFNMALIYVGLGENDLAFEWLDKACAERSSWLVSLKVEPLFDGLHADPRFAELLSQMNPAS